MFAKHSSLTGERIIRNARYVRRSITAALAAAFVIPAGPQWIDRAPDSILIFDTNDEPVLTDFYGQARPGDRCVPNIPAL
jgi:hypothetical protein